MTRREKFEEIRSTFVKSLQIPQAEKVSQWAERVRMLSPESSSERGKWHNRPFQSEMMDALTPDSPYEQVVLMVGSQTGKTEIALNFVGYVIDRDPGPVLVVEPREVDARTFSKDRLMPMIRDTAELRAKLQRRTFLTKYMDETKAVSNSALHKKFAGGHITIAGSNSPSGLAMRPVRYLMLDEVDRYPVSAGAEGDPVMLAIRRTDEFRWNKKILLCSTPTIDGFSRIQRAYEDSDQRRPQVPCPVCGEYQELDFHRLRWDKEKPETAAYQCGACEKMIPSYRKGWMLSEGRWVITHPENTNIAGFWLSQMYSVRRSWADLAREFEQVKRAPESLRVFINTALAQTWKEQTEVPDWKQLYERAEDYPLHRVPQGGLFLTAGIDVQEDRLEMMVGAWGRNREFWLVDYIIIEGSVRQVAPLRRPDGSVVPSVWERLTQQYNATWAHAVTGVRMPLLMTSIDCGWATQEVYRWARTMGPSRLMVVRGLETDTNRNAIVGTPTAVEVTFAGQKIKRGTKYWPISGSQAKDALHARLRLEKPIAESGDPFPGGYCHFPRLSADFFKQLTAEALEIRVDRKGYRKATWVKHYRNEALDTWVYAYAAALRYGLDRFGARDWAAFERSITKSEEPIPALTLATPEPVVSAASPERSEESVPPAEKPIVPQQSILMGRGRRRGGQYSPRWQP